MANLLFRASLTPTVPSSTTVKNAPLTNLEIDGNFKAINDNLAAILPDQGSNTNELLLTNGTNTEWSDGLTYSSGTLTTTNFNATSDITLKKNIKTVDSALSIVDKLNGIEFEWKDTDKKSSGVVAQELEEVLPHLVETNHNGIKTVNYAGLSAYLIQAIKELNAKIESK